MYGLFIIYSQKLFILCILNNNLKFIGYVINYRKKLCFRKGLKLKFWYVFVFIKNIIKS